MRDFLRSLPVFGGTIRDFDLTALPEDPRELFGSWLREAVEDDVLEPHAMTLSTVDADGAPDARALILKDLDDQGWWFASSAQSVKGTQLSANPDAALTFYWPRVARQIRVKGPVTTGSTEQSEADFRSRGVGARAVALASRESHPLTDRATCALAVADAAARIAAQPDLVSPTWQVYAVAAHTVEFWQADKDRQHIRVQYHRTKTRWAHLLLWP